MSTPSFEHTKVLSHAFEHEHVSCYAPSLARLLRLCLPPALPETLYPGFLAVVSVGWPGLTPIPHLYKQPAKEPIIQPQHIHYYRVLETIIQAAPAHLCMAPYT